METLRSAAEEIAAHALRSLLTLVGIVLGCMGLVVMSSVMDGVKESVRQGFSDIGFDGVFTVSRRSPRTPAERLAFQRSRGLEHSDVVALRERSDTLSAVSGRAEMTALASANGRAVDVRVIGVEPSYAIVRNRRPAEGRFISEGDVLADSRVCVLGSELRKKAFGTEPCIGREVTIAGTRFTVVGVGRKLGNSWFREGMLVQEMEGVMVPLRVLVRDLRGDGLIDSIEVKMKDPDALEAAKAEVHRLLLTTHQGVEDFDLENQAGEMLRSRDEAGTQLRNWRIVMLSVAAVTLLVGGVGLLSVLLISLAERTYEIGVRKALGATSASIFALFLVESLALATAGAVVGIALGIGVTRLAARGFKDGLPLSVEGMVLAALAALAVGLLFGLGPAHRAGRMAPVDALRERA